MSSFIDSHIHLWDLKNNYPWINNNDNKNLKKNYLINNLENDAQKLNLKKIIHIQAEIDPTKKIFETEWLQQISDKHPLNFPNGIIGYVNLLDDMAQRDIEKHIQYKNFRGIRQILKSKDRKNNLLLNKKWIENFVLLQKFNLCFDLLIHYTQFKEAIKLIQKYPDVQFIINHALWPEGSENDFDSWKESINQLSLFENVAIKISGFGEWQVNWTINSIKNYIKIIIEYFGTKRSMFASNFPVDKCFSSSSYYSFWNAYFETTVNFNHNEKEDLFVKNAERIYRI